MYTRILLFFSLFVWGNIIIFSQNGIVKFEPVHEQIDSVKPSLTNCSFVTNTDELKKKINAYMLYMGYERLYSDDFYVLTYEKLKNVTFKNKSTYKNSSKQKGSLVKSYESKMMNYRITFNILSEGTESWYIYIDKFESLANQERILGSEMIKGQTFDNEMLRNYLKGYFKSVED